MPLPVASYNRTNSNESAQRQSVQPHCAAAEKVIKNKKILRGIQTRKRFIVELFLEGLKKGI